MDNLLQELKKQKDKEYIAYQEQLSCLVEQLEEKVFISLQSTEQPYQTFETAGTIYVATHLSDVVKEKRPYHFAMLAVHFRFTSKDLHEENSIIKIVKPSKVEFRAGIDYRENSQLIDLLGKLKNCQQFALEEFHTIEDILRTTFRVYCQKNEQHENWSSIGKSEPAYCGQGSSPKEVLLHNSLIKNFSQRLVDLWTKQKSSIDENYIRAIEKALLEHSLQAKAPSKKMKI